jgi:hypothetical protein
MATIAEVRDKYPQYQDLSDDQLGQALHKKYYADIPYEEFAGKVGLQANVNEGIRNPVMDSRAASVDAAKANQFEQQRTHESRMRSDPYYKVAQEQNPAQNALAAMGGVFKGLGYTGPRQIMGMAKPGEYEQHEAAMSGLNSTGAGKFGSFIGYGAPAAATAPFTGASVPGAAIVTGIESFLDPAASHTNRAVKTVLGTAAGAAGQKFANVLGNAATNARATRQLRSYPGSETVAEKTLGNTLDMRYKLPPSAAGKQSIRESISGQIKTQQAMSDYNQNITDMAMRSELGDASRFGYQVTPNTPLTSNTLREIRAAAGKPYAEIKQLGQLPVGPAKTVKQYVDETGNVVKPPKFPAKPKTRNILAEIKKEGGLSAADLPNYGLTMKDANMMYPGLFRKSGGMSPDDLTEWAGQKGWVFQQYIDEADAGMTGGSHELTRDMVKTALGKERLTHPADFDAVYSYDETVKNLNESLKGVTRKDKVIQSKIDTAKTVEDLKQLRHDGYSQLSSARLSGDPQALKQARKMLDDAAEIEKNLETALSGAGKKELLDDLKAARQLIAKSYNIQDAVRESVGKVDARDIGALYEMGEKGFGPKLTGKLADVGKAGSAFKESMALRGFDAPRYSALDFGMAGMNFANNASNPAGWLSGGIPLLRGMARDSLMTDAAQAALRPNNLPPNTLQNILPYLLDYTPNIGGRPYPLSRTLLPAAMPGLLYSEPSR